MRHLESGRVLEPVRVTSTCKGSGATGAVTSGKNQVNMRFQELKEGGMTPVLPAPDSCSAFATHFTICGRIFQQMWFSGIFFVCLSFIL